MFYGPRSEINADGDDDDSPIIRASKNLQNKDRIKIKRRRQLNANAC